LKVIDLGLHAIGRADLRELARPILHSLVDEVSEAASLDVLDGADIL
jgi:IclR family pca regulon transcriptional regulator